MITSLSHPRICSAFRLRLTVASVGYFSRNAEANSSGFSKRRFTSSGAAAGFFSANELPHSPCTEQASVPCGRHVCAVEPSRAPRSCRYTTWPASPGSGLHETHFAQLVGWNGRKAAVSAGATGVAGGRAASPSSPGKASATTAENLIMGTSYGTSGRLQGERQHAEGRLFVAGRCHLKEESGGPRGTHQPIFAMSGEQDPTVRVDDLENDVVVAAGIPIGSG